MATLINNAGVQHYANKMVLAENRKVGSKSLPTALNDIDNLIDEMKTHFDAEYGSALDMKLENNENAFSVGIGTNVDKRSEVENSFTDVQLSGNSLVNLCVTDVGRLHFVADGTPNIKHYKTTAIKPNTKYTIITNVLKNTINNNLGIVGWNITDDYNQVIIPREYVGLFKSCFTTNDTIREVWELDFWRENTIGEIEIENIIILEGDWTNKPVPQYFQGLKSIGEKEDGNHKISISSMGKNLFNMKRVDIRGNAKILNKTYNSVTVTTLQSWAGIQIVNLKLKPNTNYKLKFDRNNDKIKAYIRVRTASGKYSGNANFGGSNDLKFTMPKHSDYIALSIETEVPLENAIISNIQLEENSTATSYEPYKEDKKEISLNEPLRRLPNGVKDTIEKINGEWKIVRRCGEIIFNGEEDWILSDFNGETTSRYRLYLTTTDIAKKINSIGICDTIPVYLNSYWRQDFEMIENDATFINIRKKIYNNLNEFKEWLSQNPTKVVYELATPIIEDISPVTLQCWKNGTISIDEVLPVETTHTVALNKPAQIKRNIEELTALRKRVQALEDFYDQTALEQAHQLSLMNHSIELDYNI